MTDMKAAALRYADAGIPIFPCEPGGKDPLVKHGFKDATTDLEKVERWWSVAWPNANIGMPTGKASGFVVVDADSQDALKSVGKFPASLRATTGRGVHLYYKAPDSPIPNSVGKVAEHVDIRGDGGYVILPPSLHHSGKRYAWKGPDIVDGEAATLTHEQIEEITKPGGSDTLQAASIAPDQIIEGGRNAALTSEGGSMRRRGWGESEIFDSLMLFNKSRCNPPLPEDEVRGIARSVAKYPMEVSHGSVPNVPVPYKESTPGTPSQTGLSRLATRRGHAPPGSKAAVQVKGLKRPKPVEWLVQDMILKGHTSGIYGMGGSLKSIMGAHMAVTVASGQDTWLGQAVKPCKVLYLDFELDWRAQGNRFYDLLAGMGMDDLPEDLFYLSGIHTDTHTAFQTALDTCEEEGIGLVILDSVGFAMQGDSESSSDVLGFLNNYVVPFEAAGVSLLTLDHIAKPQKGANGKSPNWRDMLPFGSVYKFNKARCMWQAHGDKDDHGVTVTLHHKKSNFGAVQNDYVVRGRFAHEYIEVTRTNIDPDKGNHVPTAEEKIMDALLSGPKYPRELEEATNVKLQTVKNMLKKMREKGMVEYTGEEHKQAYQVRVTAEYDPNSLLSKQA